ncbi:MAG TPA: DnaJ domain-containing protein [Azospirillaceae bacterium]|nr:DnaJ domain-containing protein [Azospirillaceae bacterium]
MQILLLGLAILIGLYLLARAFLAADPRTLALALKWLAGIVAALAVLAFVLTGRLGMLFGLAALLLPLVRRFSLWKWRPSAWGTAGSAQPRADTSVETDTVRVWLDHATGAMDGEARVGPMAGERLSALSLERILELLSHARREDASAVALLETYLDRHHEGWREASGEAEPEPDQPASGRSGMSAAEAYEVLGLSEGATEEDIRQAHKRLMMRNHPDQGGSTYLAARINQAKDILLGKRRAGT